MIGFVSILLNFSSSGFIFIGFMFFWLKTPRICMWVLCDCGFCLSVLIWLLISRSGFWLYVYKYVWRWGFRGIFYQLGLYWLGFGFSDSVSRVSYEVFWLFWWALNIRWVIDFVRKFGFGGDGIRRWLRWKKRSFVSRISNPWLHQVPRFPKAVVVLLSSHRGYLALLQHHHLIGNVCLLPTSAL